MVVEDVVVVEESTSCEETKRAAARHASLSARSVAPHYARLELIFSTASFDEIDEVSAFHACAADSSAVDVDLEVALLGLERK